MPSTSSHSPPAARTKSRTHSAARTTSAWCSGSALTLGMRRTSESSSNQVGSIAAAKAANASYLRNVAELLALGQRAQLLQRLVLDLPDALACDVEGAADLVERPRVLAVQSRNAARAPCARAGRAARGSSPASPSAGDLGRLLGSGTDSSVMKCRTRTPLRRRQASPATPATGPSGGSVRPPPVSARGLARSRRRAARARARRAACARSGRSCSASRRRGPASGSCAPLSASARATAWRIHHVAYVENLKPLR